MKSIDQIEEIEKLSDDELYFKNIIVGDKYIKKCELVYKSNSSRLYINRGEGCFTALAVNFVSVPVTNINEDDWENEELIVSKIFQAIAFSDGIRHLEFNRNGEEMDGYLYYPDMDNLITMLKIVRELELKICPYSE